MVKGVPEEKIEVIYNWVDQNAVVDIPREENKLFDKYGLNRGKFYITYNGNIGLTQNMDMLLEVAKALETNEDIHRPSALGFDENQELVAHQHAQVVVRLVQQNGVERYGADFAFGDVQILMKVVDKLRRIARYVKKVAKYGVFAVAFGAQIIFVLGHFISPTLVVYIVSVSRAIIKENFGLSKN